MGAAPVWGCRRYSRLTAPTPEGTVVPDSQQNPDGSWSPAEPIALTDDFDVEVYGTGPYRWEAWVGTTRVGSGQSRTRIGLRFAIARARRRTAPSAV